MPSQRQEEQSRFRPAHFDISLWHLGAGLLVAGAALRATFGLPASPSSVVIGLMNSLRHGWPAPAGLGNLSEAAGAAGSSVSIASSLVDIELLFRSPSTTQLDAAAAMVCWIAWALWLWLLATTVLRILVVVCDRIGAGGLWSARLRSVSDRVTLSLVRQAVDATLASELLLRSVAPAPTPAVPMRVEHALVQSIAGHKPPLDVQAIQERELTMAQDIRPGDVLYVVQSGDTLSGIAERFYGDPLAFERIVLANLGREQPGGTTLRDARFIYPGWQLVLPQPTQTIDTDADDRDWYTVRAGDTLSEISAELLGDWQRYPELFADNKGAELGDGHVLTNPNLIWPGLRLRLPLHPAEEEAVEPPTDGSPPAPPPTTSPAATPLATPPARASSTAGEPNGSGVTATRNGHAESTPSGALPPAETPVQASDDAGNNDTPDRWPEWLPGGAGADLAIAGGLAGITVLAFAARRRRKSAPSPESDTRMDEHAFTVAEPATVASSRAAGAGSDPHGIVTGELLAGEIMRHSRVAELSSVRVVSVIGGRSGSAVTLSTSLEDRPLLETALRTDTQLARRVEVSRSAEQDVVVRLRGVRQEALARVSVQDCPILLCVGMLPDSRSYLVSWEALGHVLAATQPGTSDAEEHLAALVATLAGQLAPSQLHLYTVASANTVISQLAALPHQHATADSANDAAVGEILQGLRRELERRQFEGYDADSEPQLVLVASELGDIHADEELSYLLSHGERFGVRVMAATASSDLERGPLVQLFSTQLVFALSDEEASTHLLGTPWALTLAEPGRLLVRVGQRKEVEVLGLHLTEEGRLALLATMGVAEPAPTMVPATRPVDPNEGDAAPLEVSENDQEKAEAEAPSESGNLPPSDRGDDTDSQAQTTTEQVPAAAVESVLPTVEPVGRLFEDAELVVDRARTSVRNVASVIVATDQPHRIGKLLGVAPLVVDCDEASVWSSQGRLDIGQSSPVEVLMYLAAAPLLHQGRLADWAGVEPEMLLQEIWAPRARDPQNRDSAQTWLGKNLARLQEEIVRARGGLDGQIVIKQPGGLRLNRDVMASDVEAFMETLEHARAAQGLEQIGAAEEAFGLRVTGLLSRVVRKPKTTGPKVEFFRWLGQPHWERAAGRLDALGRDAAMLLARTYRDAGRNEEALARYDELLGEDPLDRRAQEGMLVAAAGTRDIVRLEQAWQQVCACVAGDDDSDVRALYEKLRREVSTARSTHANGVSRVLSPAERHS